MSLVSPLEPFKSIFERSRKYFLNCYSLPAAEITPLIKASKESGLILGGKQILSLTGECIRGSEGVSAIIHELMHTIGFYHEQSLFLKLNLRSS